MSKVARKITLRLCTILTIIAIGSFIVINFSPLGVAGLKNITSSAEILDFKAGFSFNTAFDILTNLGEAGRAFYLRLVISLDFVFPLTYGFFIFGWIAILLKNVKAKNKYYSMLFLPIVTILADWTENIGIITLLQTYPNISSNVVRFTSVFGMIKRFAIMLSILVIVILSIELLMKKISNKRR